MFKKYLKLFCKKKNNIQLILPHLAECKSHRHNGTIYGLNSSALEINKNNKNGKEIHFKFSYILNKWKSGSVAWMPTNAPHLE